ncbi:MAG: hypothetical protein M3454_01650 [Actinomycetota bacterium]|nr:hypothetical protein [Actinomycetota bacterium]
MASRPTRASIIPAAQPRSATLNIGVLVGDEQLALHEPDIRLDAREAVGQRFEQRSLVLEVVVCLRSGERYGGMLCNRVARRPRAGASGARTAEAASPKPSRARKKVERR